eukprot:g3804.t1
MAHTHSEDVREAGLDSPELEQLGHGNSSSNSNIGGNSGPGGSGGSSGGGGAAGEPGSPNKLVAALRGANRKQREELQLLRDERDELLGKFSMDYAAIKERENVALSEKNSELFAKWQEEREARLEAEKELDAVGDNDGKLRGKVRRMMETLRMEREARRRAEGEVDGLEAKVKALTDHIEKMVVALRLQAKKKSTAGTNTAELDRQLKLAEKKSELMKERAHVSEKAIHHLKSQAEMLAGQLKLADERYHSLREVLQHERRQKRQEKQRLEQMVVDTSIMAAESAAGGGMLADFGGGGGGGNGPGSKASDSMVDKMLRQNQRVDEMMAKKRLEQGFKSGAHYDGSRTRPKDAIKLTLPDEESRLYAQPDRQHGGAGGGGPLSPTHPMAGPNGLMELSEAAAAAGGQVDGWGSEFTVAPAAAPGYDQLLAPPPAAAKLRSLPMSVTRKQDKLLEKARTMHAAPKTRLSDVMPSREELDQLLRQA